MPATERDNSQEGSVGSREQEFSQLTSVTAGRYRVDYRDGEQRQTSMTGGGGGQFLFLTRSDPTMKTFNRLHLCTYI